MNLIGNVRNKTAIVVDDLLILRAPSLGAKALVEHGAKEVYVCCTHPVLSGSAVERIKIPTLRRFW